VENFKKESLKQLFQPAKKSKGEDNGQVVIIGGSFLFHGAPLLSLKTASRIVDMVFFASPHPSIGKVAEKIKSQLFSFVWVPWEEVEEYVRKSDAVLIGPGFMRFKSEKIPHGKRYRECDEACQISQGITQKLFQTFPQKKWVIDAGSLQVIEKTWIPENAILTPNQKEFEMLFGKISPQKAAKEMKCIIVLKGPETIVCSAKKCVIVKGGNPGMTKGGTGDVQAGLTVALLAKNEPFLAAVSAAHIIKASADELYKKVGTFYNADDLAQAIALFFPQNLR